MSSSISDLLVRVNLAKSDRLSETQLQLLFEELDSRSMFNEMVQIFLCYKRTINTHFFFIRNVFNMNIEKADLKTLITDEIKEDIEAMFDRFPGIDNIAIDQKKEGTFIHLLYTKIKV
jgi:hypothetical protein